MASGYDNEWMTTFIYNQDIRSYIFNNLLFSVVKNGVYNADISIGSRTSGGSVLELTLKKGTTLIFSNDYIKNPISGRYERNFGGNINRESNIEASVIKCVARKDYISKFNIGTSNTTGAKVLSLDDTKQPLYVIAYLKYNTDNSVDTVIPRFGLFTKSESSSNNEGFYFQSLYADSGITIAEGCKEDPSQKSSLYPLMYLILGVLVPSSSTDTYTAVNDDWYKRHAFTCKGFPEYRYPMVSSKSIPSADVLIKYDIERKIPTLYVDWEKVLIKGDYYNKEVDWRYTYLEDSSFYPSNATKLESSDITLSDEEYTLANKEDTLVIDFVFAKVNNNLNNSESPSSSDLLYTLNFAENSDDLQIFTYRYIGTYNSKLYNLKQYTKDEANNYTLWLDKGKTNKDRLLAFLENKGIIKKVLNNIRQKGLVDGFNSVIPVAVAFRDLKSGDAFSTISNINPANVLCLLDLASESKDINKIDSTVADVYNVVSVID